MSVKWSAFAAGSAIGGTDVPVGLQSGANVQWTMNQLKTWTSASPTLVTPALGVATGTSLALGGATLGANALAVTGSSTLSGALLFSADNTYDIGAAGATRPRNLYLSGSISAEVAGFSVDSVSGNVQIYTLGTLQWSNDMILSRSAAATLQLGAADAAAPVAQTLQVQSVISTTADTAGTDWTLNSSQSTGAAISGKVIWQLSPKGGASRTASSVTCTSASPGVFSLTSHGLAVGQPFILGGTTSPPPYVKGTTYYVCNDANYGANAFTGSTTLANALAGTAINTSGTGTAVTLSTGQNGLIPGLTLAGAAGTFSNSSSRTQVGFPSTVVGYQAALDVKATDGFLYIPTCAGTPTGTPTSYTGKVALVYDTSAHAFWIYDGGGWKEPKTPLAAAIVTWQ